jgi:sec-independent protein translocase protein TatB
MLGNLDPAKMLIILVLALVVIGPERLPRFARQAGSMWREVTRVRQQVVDEVRSAVPEIDQLPKIPKLKPGAVSGFLNDLTRSPAGAAGAVAAGAVVAGGALAAGETGVAGDGEAAGTTTYAGEALPGASATAGELLSGAVSVLPQGISGGVQTRQAPALADQPSGGSSEGGYDDPAMN